VSDLRGLGFGSFCSRPKWDWGLGPRSDPRAMRVRQGGDPKGLGDGSVSGPKGIRSVSAPYGVGVGVWVLFWSDPRGLWFGSFRVRTQGGLGSCPTEEGFCAGCLCQQLQHTMPPPNVQSTVK
jgi:hypothetical protein